MSRIATFRWWAQAAITMLLVALSYEAKLGNVILPGVPFGSVAIAAVVFAFGSKFAEFLVKLMLRSTRLRRYIAGNMYIEGYWMLKTDNPHGADSSLTQPGVASMQYDPWENDMKVETIRYTSEGEKYVTISTIAHARISGLTIQYLNCFRLTYPGPEDKIGLSFGKFSHEGESYPVSLEAHIAVAGEGASRRQSAIRIEDDVVSAYKKEHGRDWTKRYISDVSAGLYKKDPAEAGSVGTDESAGQTRGSSAAIFDATYDGKA